MLVSHCVGPLYPPISLVQIETDSIDDLSGMFGNVDGIIEWSASSVPDDLLGEPESRDQCTDRVLGE